MNKSDVYQEVVKESEDGYATYRNNLLKKMDDKGNIVVGDMELTTLTNYAYHLGFVSGQASTLSQRDAEVRQEERDRLDAIMVRVSRKGLRKIRTLQLIREQLSADSLPTDKETQ